MRDPISGKQYNVSCIRPLAIRSRLRSFVSCASAYNSFFSIKADHLCANQLGVHHPTALNILLATS
ncbi:hypothetical protein T4E_4194 [Trichinella pseudospiralis]|uniref:Uncharacterized protein n=1 Tax=Trichinella pseudospiralis TaxID=6337 RepID=A0A0V0Y059_TRIPS|nr:hypothetical protein T4E_4194 [Trichinella pseudospiralis]